MQRHDVDIMAINETWLREGEEGRTPAVPGYRLRHIPRSTDRFSRGGGVGFYIRCGVTARVLAHPPTAQVEQMWLRMTINGKKIVIGTAYRPPWLNVDSFLEGLSTSLESFGWAQNVILMGDFNINLLDVNDSCTKKLYSLLRCFKLNQYVNEPTHFTSYSETLIDLICSDIKGCTVTVDCVQDLSRHAFITCELNVAKDKPSPIKYSRRVLSGIDPDLFNSDLVSMDWKSIQDCANVDEMVTHFDNNLTCLYDLHAPIKTTYVKFHQYPWITYDIKLLMRRRDEAHARARLSGVDSHKSYYKDLKGEVENALFREKRAYFDFYVNLNIDDPRTMWKHIKLNVRLKVKHDLPAHIFSDPDAINDHFLNVPGSDVVLLSTLTYFEFHCDTSEIFNLRKVTQDEVFKVIKSLKSKAIGADGISLDMLNLALDDSTLSAITTILNRSIESHTFPTTWQTAVVKPIPKNSCPTTFKDLRPISILPCSSKILEKIVANQVRQYLEKNEILPRKQSGFRKSHGTTTALLDVVDEILSASNEGEGTILTLLDFSRAFDCINISLLLAKMHYYGFSAETIKWFHSYFEYRIQYVELLDESGNAVKSQPKRVTRGVPQGSILGPLLFVLYSADVIKQIQHSKYHIYFMLMISKFMYLASRVIHIWR